VKIQTLKKGDKVFFLWKKPAMDLFHWIILEISWENAIINCENKNINKEEKFENLEIPISKLKFKKK